MMSPWIVQTWEGGKWVKFNQAESEKTARNIAENASSYYRICARVLDPLLKVVVTVGKVYL